MPIADHNLDYQAANCREPRTNFTRVEGTRKVRCNGCLKMVQLHGNGKMKTHSNGGKR